jgi:hypothetical protein
MPTLNAPRPLTSHMQMHNDAGAQWGHTMSVHADHVTVEQLAVPASVPEDLLLVPKFELITKADDQLPHHIQNIR